MPVSLQQHKLPHNTPMVTFLLTPYPLLLLKCQQFFDFLERQPPCLTYRQHSLQQISYSLTHLLRKPQRLSHDSTQQTFLTFSIPRQTPKNKLVKNNPQRPYIALTCILNPLQNLRSHVIRCPHMRPQHALSLM